MGTGTSTHRAALYARVSTLDQEPENQLAELRRYVEARSWTAAEYVDHGVSGAKERRPALDRVEPNPLYCSTSPRCPHHWHYDIRINRRRYRASAETANKHQARDIEARERARILAGLHGIRRQPDTTFRQFAKIYLRDHAELHKRSVARDREIIKTVNQWFGSLVLHEITAHRIEQFKRERLRGTWKAHRQQRRAKPIQPSTVNRELDTLKSILSKAVEWGKLVDSPAKLVKRLRVENQRTRILTLDEQRRLLKACGPTLQAIVTLALITTARIGELLKRFS